MDWQTALTNVFGPTWATCLRDDPSYAETYIDRNPTRWQNVEHTGLLRIPVDPDVGYTTDHDGNWE